MIILLLNIAKCVLVVGGAAWLMGAALMVLSLCLIVALSDRRAPAPQFLALNPRLFS